MRGDPAQAAKMMQAAGGELAFQDDGIALAERLDSVLDPWPAADGREEINLDFDVTDQDSRPMKLRALAGKPTVVSFLFTRCPNPRMCPFIASRMAALQRLVAASGLSGDVRLLIVTYDPVYDTPARLRQYAQVRGMSFDNLSLLRPEPAQLTKLLGEFQTPLAFTESGGVNNHAMDVFILDSAGRYVRQYRGSWSNSRILSDLRRLLAEERAASLSATVR
jgi:protein SCO1/2